MCNIIVYSIIVYLVSMCQIWCELANYFIQKCYSNSRTVIMFKMEILFYFVKTRSTRTIEAQNSQITRKPSPPLIPGIFTLASFRNGFLIKFQVENRKDHPNRSTTNGGIAKKAKLYFVCEWHPSWRVSSYIVFILFSIASKRFRNHQTEL